MSLSQYTLGPLERQLMLPASEMGKEHVLVFFLGFLAGFSLTLNLPAIPIFLLLASVKFALQNGKRGIALWAGSFYLGAGFWIVTGFETLLNTLLAFFALPAFFAFGYQLVISLILGMTRLPLGLAFVLSVGTIEALAPKLGLALPNLGLAVIYSGLEPLVEFAGIGTASVLLALIAVALTSDVLKNLPICSAICAFAFFLPTVAAQQVPIEVATVNQQDASLNKWEMSDAKAMHGEFLRNTELANPSALKIWPETAITLTMDREQAIKGIPKDFFPLIVGHTEAASEGATYYNSAYLITEQAVQVSQKEVLVPFFERQYFSSKRFGLQPGKRKIFDFENVRILPLICYEVALPASQLEGDFDMIVVLAAERVFVGPFAESFMDRVARSRELELKVPVVRATDAQSIEVKSYQPQNKGDNPAS